MIYLKRIWNALVSLFAFIMGLICVPLMLIEKTIVAFVYYIITGEDYTEKYWSTAYYVSKWVYNKLTVKID